MAICREFSADSPVGFTGARKPPVITVRNGTALERAELVESPADRGAVLISIWFDQAEEGNLRRRVSYERAGD